MTARLPALTAVSDKTLADHRMAWLRAISDRFRGMGFTVEGSSWRGAWPDGHDHVADSMGILWLDISDCPRCIEHEFPGWQVTFRTGKGYSGTDGERVVAGRSRTQFVCRMAVASVAAR